MKIHLILILFLYQISLAQSSDVVIKSIAKANGIESWNAVKQINFTFNIDWKGKNTTKRAWKWRPKTNDITLEENEKTITYNQSKLDSLSLAVDKKFINDKFWLVFPFQLAWDKGTTITLKGKHSSPIHNANLNQLTIVYDNEKGYTPGDGYDVFYDDNYAIKEWVFRKGNQKEPSLVTTFETPEIYKGITIYKEYSTKEGNFRLYFTEISVQTID